MRNRGAETFDEIVLIKMLSKFKNFEGQLVPRVEN